MRRIGYSAATLPLRGYTDTLTVDVVLTASTVQLEELVITAAAGVVERKALGNAVYGTRARGMVPS